MGVTDLPSIRKLILIKMRRIMSLLKVGEMPEKFQSSKPKVSVIIPCYNGEEFIGGAIKSVSNQPTKILK